MRKVGDTDIVDAYLNRHEHTFTVEDVLSFSRRAGLVFQGWWDNIDYYPEANLGDDPAICEAIARLPREAQWPVVELLAPRIGRHRFLLRADGDETSRLRIPFGSDEICSLVPSRRRGLRMARSGATGTQIAREWHRMTLRGWQENVFVAVDGVSTVAEITAALIAGSTATISDVSWFVERLWRMGHVTLSRRPS